ncbi:MAG TPA: hypothetical protein VF978_00620 [Gemmatimonadales bacterium]
MPGERFTVVFAARQAQGVATVSLTDGPEITVRTLNGVATFTTEAHRLTIENRASTADYTIELPRNALWVEVWVEGRRLLRLQGARITTDAPLDARGRYLLPLTPPAR